MINLRNFTAVAATVLLAACGGDSSTAVVEVGVSAGVIGSAVPFADATSTVDSSLRYVAVTNQGVGVAANTAALDHNGGTITGGRLGGVLNAPRTQVTLTNGGIADLQNPQATQYLRIFRTQGTGADRFGVVGVQTDPATMPTTGSATFNGSVEMQATNTTDSYALVGDAAITANWGSPARVNSTFNNFTVTSGNGAGLATIGTLTITNAPLADAAFLGGTPSGTGDLFGTVATSAKMTGTRGEFFGPGAAEVGGVVVLKQTTLEVIGVYIAK